MTIEVFVLENYIPLLQIRKNFQSGNSKKYKILRICTYIDMYQFFFFAVQMEGDEENEINFQNLTIFF